MYTKEFIKKNLLINSLFIDNEYLSMYLDLVSESYDEKYYVEKHHILPKHYYKELMISDKSTINNVENIVSLPYKEHILAHYYLYKCSNSKSIKRANLIALFSMLNEKHLEDIESIIFNNLEEFNNLKKS